MRDHKKTRERQRRGQAAQRARTRALITGIKVEAGCGICGTRHPAVLQFHHKDASTKTVSINRFIATKRPTEKLFEEIAKCEVLCANCHAIRHWDETH